MGWLRGVSFTDANNGTAVGYYVFTSSRGVILRTTNGGTSWAEQLNTKGRPLFGVSFTDANNGTAVGYGYIFPPFSEQQTVERPGFYNQSQQAILCMVYLLLMRIMEQLLVMEIILRTTNGGTTWISQTSGTTTI